MKLSLLLLGFMLATLSLRGTDAAPSPYEPIAWLAGGTWKATLPPDKNGASVELELQVVVPANGQGLRFDSTFLIGGKPRPYTSGMYAWDAAKRKFAIFYTDSTGSLSAGNAVMEDGVLVHDYTATEPDGTVERIRVQLTRVETNAFTNEIFVRKGDAWNKIVLVRYVRQP